MSRISGRCPAPVVTLFVVCDRHGHDKQIGDTASLHYRQTRDESLNQITIFPPDVVIGLSCEKVMIIGQIPSSVQQPSYATLADDPFEVDSERDPSRRSMFVGANLLPVVAMHEPQYSLGNSR